MLFIHLHGLKLYGYHGVYDEERILGNDYELSLTVGFTPAQLPVEHLHQTLDYTALLQLVQQRMAVATPLLETIASYIALDIQQQYPQVEKISVSIKKLFPPVNSFEGAVGVSFEWNK